MSVFFLIALSYFFQTGSLIKLGTQISAGVNG